MSNAIDIQATQVALDELHHCRVLGIAVEGDEEGRAIYTLPYSEQIVGNPATGVIAGGALTTLLDTACGYAVVHAVGHDQVSTTMDLRIDYMRPAKPGQPVYADASVYRLTDNVVFTRGKAYQDNRDEPVAHCVATFMRLPLSTTGSPGQGRKG